MKLLDMDCIKNAMAAVSEPAGLDVHDGMPAEEIASAAVKTYQAKLLEKLESAPAACDTDRIIQQLKAVNGDDNICEKIKQADRKRCKNARGCFDCAIMEALSIVETRGIL